MGSSPCSRQISCHHLYSPFRSFQCERIVCFDNLWHSTRRFIQEFTSFPFNIVKCIILLLSLSNVYCTLKKKKRGRSLRRSKLVLFVECEIIFLTYYFLYKIA